MSDRPYFSIKYNQTLGDRLILRDPALDADITQALIDVGITDIPGQITVGYYRELETPVGAWCFMPIPTQAARAALGIRMVQARIAKDLLARIFP